MSVLDPARAPAAVARLLEEARAATDAEIDRRLGLPCLPAGDPVVRLVEAMRYAALAPGKRLRPAIALAACEAVGGARAEAMPAAAAIELLHTYTLVHDDLPAMDDDDLRRGRPTVHRAYDEATAILAGDGLLTAAFAALADLGARAGDAVTVLAARAGALELLGGQALDLAATPATTIDALERLHAAKTGALFAAAAELGAIAAGAPPPHRAALAAWGLSIGIAFQHADDLDDGDFSALAADAATRRRQLGEDALSALTSLGPSAALLADVTRWVCAV
ncbi:MAG TPA: polyprenyl synthetase family protein [Kofleriaceae bacterium]|nr:polyprenyl synthetase family protein [Kofleriaceae bacterium]